MDRTVQLMLSGLSAIAVGYGFARYGFGLFVPVFRQEFGLSTQQIGLMSSAGYAAYLVAMLLAGALSDRSGPRAPVVIGGLCASLGMLLIAAAQEPLLLFVGVMLAGSSSGFCWAPFSDAVAMMVDPDHRQHVLSVVSTGTTFGLLLAGPAALLAGAQDSSGGSAWRIAWATFAATALLVACWNALILPRRPYGNGSLRVTSAAGKPRPLRLGWFLCRMSAPLLGQALLYGLVAAFYYTYAVDLVRHDDGSSQVWGAILWSLVGFAGTTGLLGGAAVLRFGLQRCLTVCLMLLAISIGMLPFGSASVTVVIIGALLFGASYMPISALLVIWSSHVFRERPATGFSAVLLCLACGSIVGPAALGHAADLFGLETAFWCTAALTALIPVLKPHADIHSASTETTSVVGSDRRENSV